MISLVVEPSVKSLENVKAIGGAPVGDVPIAVNDPGSGINVAPVGGGSKSAGSEANTIVAPTPVTNGMMATVSLSDVVPGSVKATTCGLKLNPVQVRIAISRPDSGKVNVPGPPAHSSGPVIEAARTDTLRAKHRRHNASKRNFMCFTSFKEWLHSDRHRLQP